MFSKKAGRPRTKPIELINLDQAIELIRHALMEKYKNPTIVERLTYSPGTLYNLRSQGKLTKHKGRGLALFDKHEILKLVA